MLITQVTSPWCYIKWCAPSSLPNHSHTIQRWRKVANGMCKALNSNRVVGLACPKNQSKSVWCSLKISCTRHWLYKRSRSRVCIIINIRTITIGVVSSVRSGTGEVYLKSVIIGSRVSGVSSDVMPPMLLGRRRGGRGKIVMVSTSRKQTIENENIYPL